MSFWQFSMENGFFVFKVKCLLVRAGTWLVGQELDRKYGQEETCSEVDG